MKYLLLKDLQPGDQLYIFCSSPFGRLRVEYFDGDCCILTSYFEL